MDMCACTFNLSTINLYEILFKCVCRFYFCKKNIFDAKKEYIKMGFISLIVKIITRVIRIVTMLLPLV